MFIPNVTNYNKQHGLLKENIPSKVKQILDLFLEPEKLSSLIYPNFFFLIISYKQLLASHSGFFSVTVFSVYFINDLASAQVRRVTFLRLIFNYVVGYVEIAIELIYMNTVPNYTVHCNATEFISSRECMCRAVIVHVMQIS